MASQVAPPKNTGGGGFVFEDQVCAWLLACMLADEPPLDATLGRLERLDFQTRPDGWFFDDALLTLALGKARSRCAFSIKSNHQFQGCVVPTDFIETAWEQFLGEGSSAFDQASDLLGLVTAPIDREVRAAVDSIIGKAIAEDPAVLPSRLVQPGWTNNGERTLFNSSACPTALASKHGVSEADTGRLLRCLRFLQHDFDAITSESRNAAIRFCRSALRSGDLEEATKLWEALLRIAADLRPKAGFITRMILLDRVRARFALGDRPDHRADWKRLMGLSEGAASQISNAIGGRVRLNRDAAIEEIESKLEGVQELVIIGPSGAGKSGLARQWLEQRLAQGSKTLWFDGRSFERPDFAGFESVLQLDHSLSELLGSVPDRGAAVVLDGLDRIYDPAAFRLLASLIRLLDLGRPQSPWQLILTSQVQEWSRLQDNLLQAGIRASAWRPMELKAVDPASLDEVRQAFPAVARLLGQKNLQPILGNLKILDMVVRRLSDGDIVETQQWVGESSVAGWFWAAEIERGGNGLARARILKWLAERQADTLKSTVPLDDIQSADLQHLGELINERVCERTPDEQVAFTHDLYGDWARLRILVSRTGKELADFLNSRLSSPLWHRAVRLLGLHVLEHVGDAEQWRSTLRLFASEEGGVAHDLLLESPIFAANPRRLLELIKPDLLEGDGKLLQRFLTRFLAYATLPDPEMVAFARAEGLNEVSAKAEYRYPNWPYWPAVLQFLHAYRVDVVEAAPVEIARVVEMWLKHMPVGRKVLRREAGELALALGERARQARDSYTGEDYQNRGLFYRVALAAAEELPDAVAAFARTAAERLPGDPPEETEPQSDPAPLSKSLLFDPRYDPDEPHPEPWSDGPYRPVDDEFREAALEGVTLAPLMRTRPEVAREVALAVLIKSRHRYDWQDDWHERNELCLNRGDRWNPVLYIHGPFLACLKINFSEGLELIAQLVDFATERWAAYAKADADEAAQRSSHGTRMGRLERLMEGWHRPPSSIEADVAGDRRVLLGDDRVYGWSAGLGNPPRAVEAALMALEQHLYALLDEKKGIDDEVRLVLARTRSVAFLKVLCDVGKRDETLFEGPLRPLLAVPEIYHWDLKTTLEGRSHLLFGASLFQGDWFIKLAQKFHGLEHRKKNLNQIALLLLFNRPAMREFFEAALTTWEERLKKAAQDPLKDHLEQLIIGFSLQNYEMRNDPEHGIVFLNVRAQERDEERAAERRVLEQNFFVTTLPMRCRRMIDEADPLASEDLNAFWQQLHDIHEKPRPSGEGNQLGLEECDFINATAGGIAVLVRLHHEWLEEDPQRVEWCQSRIQEIVLGPPKGSDFDVPESVGSCTWDCFAAEVLPVFWAKHPDDEALRLLMAHLVFAPHYSAVEILFRRCSEFRSNLRQDFARLRRLGLEGAYLRSRAVFVHHSQQIPGRLTAEEIKKFDEALRVFSWDRFDAFYRATSEPRWEEWADLDTTSLQSIDEARQMGHRTDYLDLKMVCNAHRWLPRLRDALDAEERQEWVIFWREALAYALSRATAARRGSNFPNEEERWIIGRVAGVMLEMATQENPEAIWNDVLRLPDEAHHWVEIFLREFHHAALTSEPVPKPYETRLRAILEAVFPKDSAPTRRWSYHDQVWDSVVGIDGSTRSQWQPRHEALVSRLSDVFERWWEQAPASGSRAGVFAQWLESPAASAIRLRGITWIERRLIANADRSFDLEDCSDAIASLLAATWQRDEAPLRADPPAFQAFRNLLRMLADEQNKLALDLLGRLGGLA